MVENRRETFVLRVYFRSINAFYSGMMSVASRSGGPQFARLVSALASTFVFKLCHILIYKAGAVNSSYFPPILSVLFLP